MRHFAVVGSGPGGFYTAEALNKAFGEQARIDIIDRYPVPYGLVRFGVAPDHQSLKAVSKRYDKVAESAGVDFIGNVCVGRDLSLAELMEFYDAVVLAIHSDQALALLEAPTADERRLIGAVPYQKNRAVLHRDASLMPKRRKAWAAWNHLGHSDRCGEGGVTYWMNDLQTLPGPNLFVSLNPACEPDPATVLGEWDYEHPVFNRAAVAAQRELWSLQGARNVWFCGAWFGSGFHEDGLQSGLAVAEQLGGVRRPWTVENESGRIHVTAPAARGASMSRPAVQVA